MVTFPPEFVATMYPGYFWNIKNRKLYSLKVTGELREIKRTDISKIKSFLRNNRSIEKMIREGIKYYYRVSVGGQRRVMFDKYLENLSQNDSVIPVRRSELKEQLSLF